nr:hypothetical protein HGMM_F04D09C13 [uncultured Gammaproteobacteria bacterium]
MNIWGGLEASTKKERQPKKCFAHCYLRAQWKTLFCIGQKAFINGPELAYCLREIRRTCETRMAEMGIGKDLRAQIQSHGLGGV